MMRKKKGFAAVLCCVLCCRGIAAVGMRSSAGQEERNLASAAFVQGADAFRAGEWMSAVFMLRRAVSYPENDTADTWYMLIAAEMYAGEYRSAFQDCEHFLAAFPDSPYVSYVSYHKGRALFYLGEYEKAVLLLSDFCHQNPEHEMYASALFWIAESFFAGYNYDEAEMLYALIVRDFPDDAKAPAAQYRIETIAQAGREEKLIYLLKEVGEEYLAAKEEYERQLRFSASESAAEARQRLIDLQRRNSDLERKVAELEAERAALQQQMDDAARRSAGGRNAELLLELKEKAKQTQQLLDKERAGDAK
ncbi:MAG: outer membrane protein assembly factor BamD [Treponemataceae bacterium]|nr:outer membrane protein assembly factor BamD [Treponemataceae bacterium]